MTRILQGVRSNFFRLPVAVLSLLFLVSSLPAQTQPVVISNVKVEPNPFSPNGDGVNETTHFTFTLSQAAKVTIELIWTSNQFQAGGVTVFNGVRTDSIYQGDHWLVFASDTIPKNSQTLLPVVINGVAGVNEVEWNGKAVTYPNKNYIQFPDTTYTYLIRVQKSGGSFQSAPVTGKVVIDSKPPSISSISASPNPFSPDNDGINDQTSISFTLGGLPNNALVGYLGFQVNVDNSGNRTFAVNTGTTTKAFYSDPDTLAVPFAPIGLQFIKRSSNSENITVQLRGGRILDSGDTVSVVGSSITISAADPVNTVYHDATKFSFISDLVNKSGGTGKVETNLIEVRTSSGSAKVDVFNSTNVKVASGLTLDPPFTGNGNYIATFPQLATNTQSDGTYSFVITAADESGNQVQSSGTVTARSNPLSVTGLTVAPDTLSPADSNGTADVAAITYSLSQDAKVTLQIFRDSTSFTAANLVRTLFSESIQSAGSRSTVWDGKDGAGKFVSLNAEHNYRVIVSALDPTNFQTSEARAPVYIDNLKPASVLLNTQPASTGSAAITVSGRTEPGSSVDIFLNGAPTVSVTADGLTGAFTSGQITLNIQGLNRIYARAYDRVKNGPTWSDTLKIVFDNLPPTITDTLIYVNGTAQRLTGRVLTSYGPADSVEFRLSDGAGRVSGVDLGRASIQATSPSGSDIEGRIVTSRPNILRFIPTGTSSVIGSYNLKVALYDSLGNSGQYTVAFSVGQASSGPTFQNATLSPVSVASGYINKSQAQPWVFTVTVSDNSGTGINPNASLIELYFTPSGQRVEGGTTFNPPGTFTFTAGGAVATDGSRDGNYELRLVVEDNDPASGTLSAQKTFLYDTRPPDTLAVSASASRVAVTLYDKPGGAGVTLLAVNNQKSSIAVTAPGGGALPGAVEYSNDGDSTLIAIFEPVLPAGIYSIALTAQDKAGNTRQRTLNFFVDGPGLRPQVVSVTGWPFGPVRTAALQNNPLTLALFLQDNSGTGINFDSTTQHLIGPDGAEVTGTLVHQGDVLAFQAGRLISSTGSDDGLWRLNAHVADFQPATSDLDTSLTFILDNRAPDTSGIAFAPDSSAIYVTLYDPPALAGRAVSGIDILGAAAAVTGPAGAVATDLSHDGISRLTLAFTNGKPAAAGTYQLTVTVSDKAGNPAALTRSFTLNVTGTVEVFPPDSSIVRGSLFRVWARAVVPARSVAPGAGASLRVNYRGVPLAGTQVVSADTLIFRFADTLAVDFSADGRYDLIADLAVPDLAGQSARRSLFTFDNRTPDTTGVRVDVSAAGVVVTASLTDFGAFPDVSGLDPRTTKAVIRDPKGADIQPGVFYWLDDNTLELEFTPLATAGLHTLRLTVADRAGWSRLVLKPLVNSFGLSAGKSVAYVEDVPARTSARIDFVSGQPGSRISRAVLRIFNLRGDLVRRVDVSDRIDPAGSAVNAEWLLTNDRGDLVMNGVFIYAWEITYDNGRREEIRKTLAVARR